MPEWTEAFATLTSKTHTEQAQWFLNGFWEDGAKDYAEDVWKMVHNFIELDTGEPVRYGKRMVEIKESSDIDELSSHRFLEMMGETLTVLALRKRLKALDIDNNKRMAISEYLLNRYEKTPAELVKSPQGDVDPAELKAATDAFDAANEALDNAIAEAEAAALALANAKEAAHAAAKALEESKAAAEKSALQLAASQEAEAKVVQAEKELQAAIDEIEALEKAKADKVAKCQAIIDDPNTGVVKKGRAVQERDAVLGEDPLPLRKAKITQKAALKRVNKARKQAEQETARSVEAKQAADDAAAASAAAKQAADEAQAAAEAAKIAADEAEAAGKKALEEAQQALEDLKAKGGGSPQGKLWWLSRILEEKKKFMK